MNTAILIGNLTRDPEHRTSSGGVSCTTFTVACQRRYANAQGVREADFIPVVTWRQTADNCAKYLKKGRKVSVQGTLQTRSYDAQDGTKRYVTEVIADQVEFLPSGQAGRGEPVPPPERGSDSYGDMQGFEQIDDEELPFA